MSTISITDCHFSDPKFLNIKNLEIPPYQREYCWEKKDCKQLLNDILSLIDKNNFKDFQHYIGSLVVISHDKDNLCEIIDGQQRITSISLLLFAIQCLFIETSSDNEILKVKSEHALNQIKKYLYSQSEINGKDQKLKLKHLNHDADIYNELLLNLNISGSERDNKINKAIKINFLFFKHELSSTLKDKNLHNPLEIINFLISILGIIERNLIFAFVRIPNNDINTAQKIFESLNNTGKKLAPSDLIRNFVLMPEISCRVTNSSDQKKFYDDWSKEIENRIKDNLDDFFRHYLTSRTGQVIANTAIYDKFKKLVIDKKYIGDTIFRDVKQVAIIYNEIKYKAHDKNLENILIKFRSLKLWSLMPLMIIIFESKNQINLNEFEPLINLVINYGFRMSSIDNTKHISPATIVNKLKNQENWQNNAIHVLTAILDMPSDESVKNAIIVKTKFRDKDFYKFILMSIEETIKKDKDITKYEKLEIEHILPQDPSQDFKSNNPNWKEILDNNLGKLGNITLATKSNNSSIKNKQIEEKIKLYYEDSCLEINKDLIELYKDSNGEIIKFIKDRTIKLIDDILQVYPYKKSSFTILETFQDEEEGDLTLDYTDIQIKNQRGEIEYSKPEKVIILIDNQKKIITSNDDKKYSWKDLINDFNEFLATNYNFKDRFVEKPRSAFATLLEMNKMCKKAGINEKNIKIFLNPNSNSYD